MKLVRLLLALLIVVITLRQGVAQFNNQSLYQYNYFYISPAFAGRDGQNFSFMSTNMFAFEPYAASGVALMSYDTKLDKINSGIGVIAGVSTLGPQTQTYLGVNYAYDLKLSENSSVRFGTRIKNERTSIDFSRYRPLDPSDPVLIGAEVEANSNLSVSLGTLLQIRDFYAGFSADNLINTGDFSFDVNSRSPSILLNTILGYSFTIGEWGELEQSVYVPIYNNKIVTIDLNSVLVINDKIITGITFEIDEEKLFPRISAGYKWNDFIQITSMIYSKRRYEMLPDGYFATSLAVRLLFK
jgi:type IX secretion system PorP/SprF family membrane protein